MADCAGVALMNTRTKISAALYVAVMAVLGLVAAWPIYQSMYALMVGVVGIGIGATIAVLSQKLRWKALLTTGVLFGSWFAAGIAIGVPSRWSTGTMFPSGLLDVLAGPVTGWKDLATAPLPIGEYRNLLIPLLTIMVVGVFFALRLSWTDAAHASLAVPVAAIMPFFGLVFGRSATSAPLALGPVTVPAPVEMATGAAAIIASVGWLAWRAREQRRAALQRAEAVTGIHATATNRAAGARRVTLAASMLVVALAAGAAVTPALTQTRTRDVLRTAVGPDLSSLLAVSPLASYRSNFTDENFDRTLFTVNSDEELPERIRLATLTDYDGEVFRVEPAADDAFQRVPSVLSAPSGEERTAEFTIDALRGSFLPSFGFLRHVEFGGNDSVRLTEGFYYDATSESAVQSQGLAEGDTYRFTGVIGETPKVETLQPPGTTAEVKPPTSLVKWLETLNVSSSGAGLMEAITALRERGYLSHALTVEEGGAAWMDEIGGGYVFSPSSAGHSLARIDQLFTQLLDRAGKTDKTADNAELVAAIGDDEQFAVASALIAQQLGFPSRVVVGVRTNDPNLPSCDDGVCRAGDLSAWVEVQGVGGDWVAIDTTPQHTAAVSTDTSRQRDPENPTDVLPDTADEVTPPDPQREDGTEVPPAPVPGPNLSTVWAVARIIGLSLLGLIVLLAPFLVVLIAKASRRRGRRNNPNPALAIAGGWDEYVDAAVDSGRQAPVAETRQELAAAYATPSATLLAATADRAVFAGVPLDASESEQFWNIVSEERRALRQDIGFWGRVRAALSLKSFSRHFAARTSVADLWSARTSERRKRRTNDA